MAKLSNLKIYQQADAGQRVFLVAPADAAAIKQGLWLRGYKVRKKATEAGVHITISK